MRRSYDILKIYKRVFQVIYLCVLFFQICVYVFVPLRSYSKYYRDKNQYDIVQAKVKDEEKYPIGLFTDEESIDTKTNELRECGLLEKYYVISEQEGYYICGCKETPRLFCFSTNLGITNTIYEDIYDYILAQIDSTNL